MSSFHQVCRGHSSVTCQLHCPFLKSCACWGSSRCAKSELIQERSLCRACSAPLDTCFCGQELSAQLVVLFALELDQYLNVLRQMLRPCSNSLSSPYGVGSPLVLTRGQSEDLQRLSRARIDRHRKVHEIQWGSRARNYRHQKMQRASRAWNLQQEAERKTALLQQWAALPQTPSLAVVARLNQLDSPKATPALAEGP